MHGAIPIGHEWITTMSAIELFGGPWMPPKEGDPRLLPENSAWLADTAGLGILRKTVLVRRITAQTHTENYYHSFYPYIFDAIVGQRWVDIAGMNVMRAKWTKHNCWDAIAQEDVRVQYDHFMRRYDEHGAESAVQAAERSVERFITYFVAAATARSMPVKVWDGGGHAKQEYVDKNFFLFGRAVHLFQDAFSPEHTVRLADDGFRRIRQVKSYLCSRGAEQHEHSTLKVVNYASGDVIWKPGTRRKLGWRNRKPEYMKLISLVATEATKDLWMAFLRALNQPEERRAAAAREEAEGIVERWLSYDGKEMSAWYENEAHRDGTYVLEEGQGGKGKSICDCLEALKITDCRQETRVEKLEADKCACLYNIEAKAGHDDLYDTQFNLPFLWTWKTRRWLTPPEGWRPKPHPRNSGRRLFLQAKGAAHKLYLDADGHVNGLGEGRPLELIWVRSGETCYFRDPHSGEFLGLGAFGKRVHLVSKAKRGLFRLEEDSRGWQVISVRRNAPIGVEKDGKGRVYLAKGGKNRKKLNLFWKLMVVEGLE